MQTMLPGKKEQFMDISKGENAYVRKWTNGGPVDIRRLLNHFIVMFGSQTAAKGVGYDYRYLGSI